jgi:hypothetical protein
VLLGNNFYTLAIRKSIRSGYSFTFQPINQWITPAPALVELVDQFQQAVIGCVDLTRQQGDLRGQVFIVIDG